MKQIWRRMTAFFLLLSMLTACATAGEYDQNGAAEDTPAVLSAQALPEAAEEEGATGEPQGEAAPEQSEAAQNDPASLEAQDAAPVIGLTVVPAYGSDTSVNGVVYAPNGEKVDAAKYRVTLYVQLSEGGTYWVKPTEATPSVSLYEDGSFALDYVAAYTDKSAKLLHILLIPADYTPLLHNFEDAKAHALDYVKVIREENGGCTVTPERSVPEQGTLKPSGLKVSADKIAVNVGFYTQGQPGDPLPRDRIRSQLSTVAAFADTVRFYSAGGDIAAAYEMAHDMGLKVVGTAWIDRNTAASRKELDALIALCDKGYVDVACVGSEVLRRGDTSADTLVQYMDDLRGRLKNQSIPVTTADIPAKLLNAPNVRRACDILMPNIYPYWEGTAIEDAAASFAASVEELARSSPGKEMVLSETGWPTAGETQGRAVAGEAQAAAYFNAIRDWSRSTGTVVLWFDAADEPWKRSEEQEAGAHWGILTKELTLKEGYAATAFFEGVTLPELPPEATSIKSLKNVSGGIRLSWEDREALRYELYWKDGSKWRKLGSTANTTYTVKKVQKKPLKSGKKYTFALKTVGESGKSPLSAAKTQLCLAPPVWKSAKNNRKGTVTLNWKIPAGAGGVQVQMDTARDFSHDKTTLPGGKKGKHTLLGMRKGETVYLRLRAWKKVGGRKTYSAWSKVRKVKVNR